MERSLTGHRGWVFDELGLWVDLSDVRDGPCEGVDLPVGWPEQERLGRGSVRLTAPFRAVGWLCIEGRCHLSVNRSAAGHFEWEPLDGWTRGPSWIELEAFNRARFEGPDRRAELTLSEPPPER